LTGISNDSEENTKTMKIIVLLALGLIAAGASYPAEGGAVFKARCVGCHGEDGKGKAAIGTPDFTSAKTQAGLTEAGLTDTITNGRKGTIMPAWKGKISDEEIAAVASYVRSLGRQ
jgi:cytochrome c oxidase cbb3-type subunit 3